MRRKLIVLGASGLAREMAMVVEHVNAREHRWELMGFISESLDEKGRDLGLAPVLGDDAWLLASDIEADLVVGVGYPKVRAKIVSKYLGQQGRFSFPNVIHPAASMDFRRIELGQGNVATAGVAMTCDIAIGDFNLFNLNCTVGHDANVGSCCVFNPSVNLSGCVRFGDRVLVGTGCQILEGLTIGADATCGAGSVVTKDVAPGDTVVGIPARPIKKA